MEELDFADVQDGITEEEELFDIIEEETKEDEENSDYIKMDYFLETPAERNQKVKEIIEQTPPEKLTPKYLDKLADYILDAINKEEKKERKILTDNNINFVNQKSFNNFIYEKFSLLFISIICSLDNLREVSIFFRSFN